MHATYLTRMATLRPPALFFGGGSGISLRES
jgi:hypothetical protein